MSNGAGDAVGPAGGSRRQLRLAVLGPVLAWCGPEPLDLGPVRQQALLVALALRPDMTVSQQELLERVWGTEPPGTGGKVIPVYVHRLRTRLRAVGGGSPDSVIASDRGGYRFLGRDVPTDLARLNGFVAEADSAGDSGDLDAAVGAFGRALELFRGEPLAGLPGPFACAERLRLAEQRVTLAQRKLSCQLRLGHYPEAVAELVALTATHPHSEPLAALLMRALYGSGRQVEALDVFTRARHRLVRDLAVEPGEELRRVHQAVLRGDDGLLLGVPARRAQAGPRTVGGARPVRRIRNELPADTGSLTGRDRELAELLAPADPGVVTVGAVDGMAGVGKTALVVRAARLLHEHYPDGCVFVDLHAHREGRGAPAPERALRRLLRAVGADDNDEPDDLDELAASWRAATAPLRLLLVLDGASATGQIRPLLPAGPGSMVLVASRQRLTGLDADRRISLGPLGLDESVALLTRIVGGARTDREQQAVRELAGLCDRLPLALRIVGARMQNRPKWTFRQLVDRLADDEHRLGELTVEDRSVEAAFQLSYDQLPAAEQHAFRALGLSPTVEFDRLALAAMLGRSPRQAEQALESLVDASLVQEATADRYRLHDLVAVYARRLASARPAEAAAARDGVLRLYLAAARCSSDWGPAGFPTGPQLEQVPFADWEEASLWLDATGGELADVVAHATAVGRLDEACWIAEGLVDYLTRQGRYHECRAAIESVLPLADTATDQRMVSSLRTCLGIAHGLQGRYERARAWLENALEISRRSGDLREQARALGALGTVARSVGETDAAVTHLAEVAGLARRLDDDWLTGMATCNIGAIHHQRGRYQEAFDCFAAALVLAEKIGSPRMIGKTQCHIGSLQLDLGRCTEAAGVLRQAAELAEQVADVPLHAVCLTRLGTAEQQAGNLGTAVGLHLRALAALGEQTSAELEIEIRNRLGGSRVAAGDLDGAREQFDLVLVLTDRHGGAEERARALDGLTRCERREA